MRAEKLSGLNIHLDKSVIAHHLRSLFFGKRKIFRIVRFMFTRRIYPHLNKLLLAAVCKDISGRTLFVNDAASGIHPLHASGINRAVISAAIAVMHAAAKYKRYRRKSTMRMCPDSCMSEVRIFRDSRLCMMQQNKWID